jgi:hypothetical protein
MSLKVPPNKNVCLLQNSIIENQYVSDFQIQDHTNIQPNEFHISNTTWCSIKLM